MSANERRHRPNTPMPAPKTFDPRSLDYLSECAVAVEPQLLSLIEEAGNAGWSRKKVVLAILIAAGDYLHRSGMELDLEDLPFIGPHPSDVLN